MWEAPSRTSCCPGRTADCTSAKTLTTPGDPTTGILAGIRLVLDGAGVDPGSVGRVVHATTIATNAILERKGSQVAFVTTRGFPSMLALGRYARVEEDRFDIFFEPPQPPLPLTSCFEVSERVTAGGSVLVPLDERGAQQVAARIAELGVDAVAIYLLHSYANPAHERRLADILRAALPAEITIVASSEVFPELREYERSTTTLMSAYVGPLMTRTSARWSNGYGKSALPPGPSDGVRRRGDVGRTRRRPRRGHHRSGPAAGVIASRMTGLALGGRT